MPMQCNKERHEGADPRQRLIISNEWIARSILPIMLLVAVLALAMASPVFLTAANLFNIAKQVASVGILSLGLLICIIGGNIDLSVGSTIGLTGALLGGLSIRYGVPWAFVVMVLVTIAVGLVNGALVASGKGLSVIVTVSTTSILRGLTYLYTDGKPIILFPMPYAFLGSGELGPVPWPVIILLTASLITHLVLNNTVWGRNLYSIGGNPEACRLSGIKVRTYVIGQFVAAAGFAALSSLVLLARVYSAQPNAGLGMEMDAISAVLIGGASLSGGTGSVGGTLLGLFMLGLINNGLNLLGVSSFYQYILKGSIILVAVLADQVRRK